MNETASAQKTALVVLGMHRGGTSAMTRVLGLSGAGLPADPHPPGEDNERGFWESQAVIALDEEILGACDSGFDDVFAGQPRHHLSNFDRVFRQRAAEVLDAAFEGDLIVLKDPRISVLAAFWDSALRAHNYEPVYIVMVRNPLEVAASMLARNKMPTDQGLLLWLDHMLACERDTRNAKRLFVGYEELLENWWGCLDRIEQVWGKSLPRRTSAAANAIEQYLSPSLRHHRAGEKALQGGSLVRRMAAEAFTWFQAACGLDELDGEALDGLRSRLTTLREAVEPILADQRGRLAEYVKHAGALEALRDQLQAELGAAREREAAREPILADNRDRLADYVKHTEALETLRDQLQAELGAAREREAAREPILADNRDRLADYVKHTEALETLRDQLQAELGAAREREAAREPILADNRDRLADYVKHTEALETLRDQLQAELGAARDREAHLQEDLVLLQDREAHLQEDLVLLQDREAHLQEDLVLLQDREAHLQEDLVLLQGAASDEEQALAEELASADARRRELVGELQEVRGQLRAALAEAAERLAEVRSSEVQKMALAVVQEELEGYREAAVLREDALDRLRAAAATWQEKDLARERTIEDLHQALEHALSNAGASAEAELGVMESRYDVLSRELMRVQAAVEDAFLRNRSLETQLGEQTRAGEGAMRDLHARELDDLRSRHAEDLQERERSLADRASGLELQLDDVRRDRQNAEREIECLLAERTQLLGSTSWRLAELPRRLMSKLRRS